MTDTLSKQPADYNKKAELSYYNNTSCLQSVLQDNASGIRICFCVKSVQMSSCLLSIWAQWEMRKHSWYT